ncbi:glycosyltransferase family 4 protein [Glutamicibacter protophormiae]|uniref:glycosyltransferase family 4 protein n=1 Tax=Glutamicibacter protophormiae TaxID=37930 RepID=UPI0019588E55|nr:glycosyltransferase family 4 protein [Glutamicibacter protophormiae]QRQ79977.1 glycosyltransferase [Glutamicibacter protophormiae]
MTEHMTPAGLARNLTNMTRLALANVADDPQYFGLQVARKFAGPRQLQLLSRVGGTQRFATLTALLGEDATGLRTAIESARPRWGEPHTAARLADAATAAGLWQCAQQVLQAPPEDATHPALLRARARLAWSLGHLETAIDLLATRPGRASRQLRHYRSERDVLQGWEPSLPARSRSWTTRGTPRVLYIATNSLPYTGSGYAQRTHSLLTALQDDGLSVWCATRAGYPLSIGHPGAPTAHTVGGIRYLRLLPARQRFDAAGRIQQQAELLARQVEQLQPTVLHTTTDFTNALAVRAVARAYDLPWVYEVRGQLADTWASTRPEASRSSQRYRAFTAREAELAASADAVLTLGQAMRENLQAAGLDPARIEVLPNGVGSDYLERITRTTARTRLGLDPRALYWGTVSSLVAYEGLETLIRATAALRPEHPNLKLAIVGDGVNREPLKRLAAELEIGDSCLFPGRVAREQARTWHAALDLFAVPRLDLPVTRAVTPLKPVEALASGVPVIASDLPALAELVQDGENGVLVPAGDLKQWVRQADRLLGDELLRRRLGEAGRGIVLRERTWSACSSKLQRIYSELDTAS